MDIIAVENNVPESAVQQIEDNILQHYPECAYDLNAYLSSLPFNTEYLTHCTIIITGPGPVGKKQSERPFVRACLKITSESVLYHGGPEYHLRRGPAPGGPAVS